MSPVALPTIADHDSVRVIASGGMGIVLEVKNRRTGVSYAAKVILQAQDPRARERFRREAELVARCDSHPGIVKVHTLGETREGSLYMILDLIRGESLEALLRREGKLEPMRAAILALGVANALAFVHERGILHRDVKPSNILLDASGGHLTDFGLATARDVQRLTVTGTFLGTLHYAAPEQASGQTTTAASDVFSLGCVLFHALSGTTPINVDTSLELMARLVDPEPLDDVRTRAAEVPASLAAIVARSVAKDPAERYLDGSALARDLERYLSGEDVTFVPARRRRRLATLLLATVILAALVLATVAAALLHGRRERGREALATAKDELARARGTNARPSATAAELDTARQRVLHAFEQRKLAADLGTDPDEQLERELPVILSDLAGALARGALARGDPAAALGAIDGWPGAPATLTETARTLRASVLLALGRPADALHEVEGRKEAEALEVAGDAHMALGHPDRAAETYDRALAVAPRATERHLRAKRGGARSLAGDDAGARADLTALLGNPPVLPVDAAPIGSIAPALYSRALAAKGANAGARDLEAAWRLGPPPPALEAEVTKAWTTAIEADAQAWNAERIATLRLNEADVDRLLAILEVANRVHRSDPRAKLREVAEALQFFRNVMTTRLADKGTPGTVRRILAVCPDDSNVLFLIGELASGASGPALREGVAALERAIDHLGDCVGSDGRFPTNLMTTLCQILDKNPSVPLDGSRLFHGGELAETTSAWETIGHCFERRGIFERALECFERGPRCRTPEGNPADAGNFLGLRAETLTHMGKLEEATELARAFNEANPTNLMGVQALALAYARAGKWDAILGLVDPAQASNAVIGLVVVEALSKRARPDEARALFARIRVGARLEEEAKRIEGEIRVDESERRIDALLRDGKKDDALDLARKLPDEVPVPAAIVLLAATLNRCELPQEAVAAIDRLQSPGARALVQRGLALVKLGKLAAARAVVAALKGRDSVYEARPVEAALAEADKARAR